MSAKCVWNYTFLLAKCPVEGCQEEARYVCRRHQAEGALCRLHRSEHRKLWLKKLAERDSRPIDPPARRAAASHRSALELPAGARS